MSVDYATIKLVHQSAVVLSLTGFFIRGAASFAGARWSPAGPPRPCPTWSTRSCCCLRVIALRPGRSLKVRAAAWVAALVTAGWIVSVAITKNPMGFFVVLV